MRVLKALLIVLAIPIALFASSIAWVYFKIEVRYPRQYELLKKEAEEWNKKHWEEGSALRVTVQVSSDKALGERTAVATVNCYRKVFARAGGLKGPPDSPAVVKSDGPEHLSIPFGPDATHSTKLRDVCYDAFLNSDEWQFPYVTKNHFYSSRIVANDQSFSCFLGIDPRTTLGKVTRPTVVSVEQVPLRELLSAEAYSAVPYRSNEPYVRPPTSYVWWTDEVKSECWREGPRAPCAPEVEAICGTPLR